MKLVKELQTGGMLDGKSINQYIRYKLEERGIAYDPRSLRADMIDCATVAKWANMRGKSAGFVFKAVDGVVESLENRTVTSCRFLYSLFSSLRPAAGKKFKKFEEDPVELKESVIRKLRKLRSATYVKYAHYVASKAREPFPQC